MRSSFFHLLVWLLIFAATFVGHGFWYAAVAEKSAIVADLQNQIETKTEAAGRVAAARATLDEIAGDEAAVQNHFISETEIVSFIDALEGRARTQGAAMKVLSVASVAKQPTLVFSLAISGTFDAVMRTVGAIEYAPYSLVVSKLSLGKDKENTWNANLEIIVGSASTRVATSTP